MHALVYILAAWVALSAVLGLFVGRCIKVGATQVPVADRPLPQPAYADTEPALDSPYRSLQPVGA